jgi:RHS repeat-associated protein
VIIENATTGYLYFQDSLGNTSHVTDSAGNLLDRYTYSAFGTPSFFSANNSQLSTSAYGIRHLFQGQLWTQETWLNDYRNRVELPTMGVFLQPDPIGFKGDAANVYRFVNNNAVNRIDPMGLYPVRVIDFDAMPQPPSSDPGPPEMVAGVNVAREMKTFDDRMNCANRPGSDSVKWSLGVDEVWDPKYDFKNKRDIAVTNWRVISAAREEEGKMRLRNLLLITIHWNTSASRGAVNFARRADSGEIEHFRDALRAGSYADGHGHTQFSSARDIADRVASNLTGRQMSLEAAKSAMEGPLRNWAERSMQDSHAEWDKPFGPHQYKEP